MQTQHADQVAMCMCEKGLMNNAFCLIAVEHEEKSSLTWEEISLANERQSVWKRNRLVERPCSLLVRACLGGTLLACPSNSFPSVHTRPRAPMLRSLESSVLRASWWVVGRVQVCAVGGTAAPLLQTLPMHGVKPHQTVEGNSCRQPARPSPEPNPKLAVSILQGLFRETNTTK